MSEEQEEKPSAGVLGGTRPKHRVLRWPMQLAGQGGRPSLRGEPPDYRPATHPIALRFARESVPEPWLRGAPSQVERFIGHIEELEPEGGVLAQVREVPGGVEFSISLNACDLVGEPVHVGALIKLFTWIETSEDPGCQELPQEPEVARLRAQVIPRTLSPEERDALRQFLEEEGVLEEPA